MEAQECQHLLKSSESKISDLKRDSNPQVEDLLEILSLSLEAIENLEHQEFVREFNSWINRKNQEGGYLPGLTPEILVKDIFDLVEDLRSSSSSSHLKQMWGNIVSPLDLYIQLASRKSLTPSIANKLVSLVRSWALLSSLKNRLLRGEFSSVEETREFHSISSWKQISGL